jgi:hypothetical protein
VHKSSILTAQYLLLALDNALKRMPMFAGKRGTTCVAFAFAIQYE